MAVYGASGGSYLSVPAEILCKGYDNRSSEGITTTINFKGEVPMRRKEIMECRHGRYAVREHAGRLWGEDRECAVGASCVRSCADGEQESTEKAVEESAEAAGETPSWKKDTSPITIDWFVAYDWYGKVFDPVNNMADKKLQTETGITINVITGNADKLNALIVSGELPDVVTFDAVASQKASGWRIPGWFWIWKNYRKSMRLI